MKPASLMLRLKDNAGSLTARNETWGKWDVEGYRTNKLGLRDETRKRKKGNRGFKDAQDGGVNTLAKKAQLQGSFTWHLSRVFGQKLVSCWVGSESDLDWRRNPQTPLCCVQCGDASHPVNLRADITSLGGRWLLALRWLNAQMACPSSSSSPSPPQATKPSPCLRN